MSLYRYYGDTLPNAVSKVNPKPLASMQGRLFNEALANSLVLPDSLTSADNITHAIANNESNIGENAVAQKYGGHQFGVWNPELGDGRGLLLGEVKNKDNSLVDLHLKGAGQTPYSRFADGRAVLRSTLREYIAGEALHAIGIPSSRSLSLLTSGSNVRREEIEPAAMMIRTAPSHIRFGHFEYYHHSEQPEILDSLAGFCLDHHFQTCAEHETPHLALFDNIVKRTARLIALWQVYGFVHGVMNTDNMSIHGITFDYGPYAFQGAFKANAVYNHSDTQGRYAFDQQPSIGLWNCYALGEGFSRYLSKEQRQTVLDSYEPVLVEQYRTHMLKRLGLYRRPQDISEQWPLAMTFLQCIANQSLDYNQVFVWLMQARQENDIQFIRNQLLDIKALDEWWPKYLEATSDHLDDNLRTMRHSNPLVLPRTGHLEKLIQAAYDENWSFIEQAVGCYSNPFTEPDADMGWLTVPEARQNHSLSCSS